MDEVKQIPYMDKIRLIRGFQTCQKVNRRDKLFKKIMVEIHRKCAY